MVQRNDDVFLIERARLFDSRRPKPETPVHAGITSECALIHGDQGACVLAAAENYVGMTAERADRAPFTADSAAAELRRLVSERVLERRATEAVLAAAGHREPKAPARRRAQNPGGLSRREVDVLGLAAKGLTTQQTRAAAALWAMQNALVQ